MAIQVLECLIELNRNFPYKLFFDHDCNGKIDKNKRESKFSIIYKAL